ncbi:MAG: bacillithiol biosynthesis BshC [Bacteroidetes bacterium]|nr:bacillithiol biosynthesis BshC [Bacteroidota bacterium]MDA1335681.1 bacillithiol biosynthesis BshC [Bacteroidota bacterium]
MIQTYTHANLLAPKSPARDWCIDPSSCDQFWKPFGNAEGLELVAKSRTIDLNLREVVGEVIRKQYIQCGIPIPDGLKEFQSGAQVVCAGHQLVVGGGAAFFHYKMLSALRWSRHLRSSGIPAITVFWMASEDHDFEEISKVIGRSSPENSIFEWRPQSRIDESPVGRLQWDETTEKSWQSWCHELGIRSGRKAENMELRERMRHWLLDYFPDEDFLVVDGDDAELKACAQFLWDAEWKGEGIENALRAVSQDFISRWNQAPLVPRSNNLFVLSDQGQRVRADRWELKHSAEAWKQLKPAQNSPNAALRPLYQEYLLQSAGFVGGPSEIGYWLLLGKAFAFHGIQMPSLILRDGGIVLDEASRVLASSLEWNPELGWWTGEEAVRRWIDQRMQKTPEIENSISNLSEALIRYASNLSGDAIPTTRAGLARMEKEYARIQKKWRKIFKQTHASECDAIEKLFEEVIRVQGQPQERVFHVGSLIEKDGGWELFRTRWFESLKDCSESQFVVFHS